MSKNESRQERKRQQNQRNRKKSTNKGISSIYYWIIGILFVILILLIVFIFSRSGDNVNLESEQDQTELTQEEGITVEEPAEGDANTNETESSDTADEADETETEEDTEEEPEQDTEEETEENTEINQGESVVVNENPPHDPGHATDYSTGSSDRVEIKERVMEVTGLESDLIESWVGNDGPGRVVATVSSRDQTEQYEVYLQYGDGNWHVTSYERTR